MWKGDGEDEGEETGKRRGHRTPISLLLSKAKHNLGRATPVSVLKDFFSPSGTNYPKPPWFARLPGVRGLLAAQGGWCGSPGRWVHRAPWHSSGFQEAAGLPGWLEQWELVNNHARSTRSVPRSPRVFTGVAE